MSESVPPLPPPDPTRGAAPGGFRDGVVGGNGESTADHRFGANQHDLYRPDQFQPGQIQPDQIQPGQIQPAQQAGDQTHAGQTHAGQSSSVQYRPGWYPDPLHSTGWRWWNGVSWTAYHGRHEKKPLLPSWLSWPVLLAAPIVGILLVYSLVQAPVAAVAAIVPGLIAIPVFVWMDRVEPEPWTSRIHAVLWGATIAILVSGVINTATFFFAGQTAAIVLSAPLVEETMKGLGVVMAVRRRELDSMSDGVIFAGLIAIGFAMVEDIEYFMSAGEAAQFFSVFVLRGILTPFAHPLFTMWIGLAVGREVAAGRGLNGRAVWGWLVAVAVHMAWNGTVVFLTEGLVPGEVVVVALGLFILLFFSVAFAVVIAATGERRDFDVIAPTLMRRYGLSETECQWFSSVGAALAHRRRLPRSARKPFDAMRAAIARLSALQQRGGNPDLEAVYANDLFTERRLLSEQLSQRR